MNKKKEWRKIKINLNLMKKIKIHLNLLHLKTAKKNYGKIFFY